MPTLGSEAKVPKKGLSLWLAAVFISGEMAGSGILALPKAFSDAGWSGVMMLGLCAFNALYAGISLGRCWIILEERWEEYKEDVRNPYPAIAFRAVGLKTRYFVSTCLDITLIGVSTVFLLLAAQLVGNLATSFGLSFCYWILILAAILCPLVWLGTPNEFWPAAIIALGTTFLASVLLLASYVKLGSTSPKYTNPTPDSFFLAFGTILFAFGGAATFPTFQNAMKDRSEFPKAASIAFCVLLLMYAPVSIMGYSIIGDALEPSVLDSFKNGPLKYTIEVLICIHLFFAFLLVFNTPVQDIEEFLNVPKKFGWKRCCIRTAVLLFIVFVALTLPRFNKILSLLGATTVSMMTFILPPFFYMKLCSQERVDWQKRTLLLYERIILIEIIAVGVIGGIISTYSAMQDIVKPGAFIPPCYVDIAGASNISSSM